MVPSTVRRVTLPPRAARTRRACAGGSSDWRARRAGQATRADRTGAPVHSHPRQSLGKTSRRRPRNGPGRGLVRERVDPGIPAVGRPTVGKALLARKRNAADPAGVRCGLVQGHVLMDARPGMVDVRTADPMNGHPPLHTRRERFVSGESRVEEIADVLRPSWLSLASQPPSDQDADGETQDSDHFHVLACPCRSTGPGERRFAFVIDGQSAAGPGRRAGGIDRDRHRSGSSARATRVVGRSCDARPPSARDRLPGLALERAACPKAAPGASGLLVCSVRLSAQ